MPSVSNYTKVDSKNSRRCIIEVDDPKSDNACLKGVFKYSLFLLCWVAVGFFLYCITLVVRENCHVYDLNDEWQVYKATYGKNYSQQEDDIRMQIFLARKNEINHHNELFIMGIVSYEKEINMFTDLTMEELEGVKCFLGQPGSVLADAYIARDDQYLPESVDWSTRGAVTGVKNQGMCGSCWAFSTTGSLEAQWFLKTGKLVSLSEQNLVDCSEPQGTFGCKGGFMTNAFDYILQNNGIDTEESYPYEGVEGECRFKRDGVGATIQGYRSVSPLEANLQAAVANIGPVSVAIDATPSFMQYRGGIFYDKSCNQVQLNHAVLVVGYGSTEGHDYWLVKNSWGPAWGESGYIRMARNMDNNCGIATMASYPLV